MTTASSNKVDQFRLMDPEVQSDPFEFYAALQEECPVYREPETGMYMVTKFEDVQAVLKDVKSFSNNLPRSMVVMGDLSDLYRSIMAEKGWVPTQTLQLTDPPEHSRYRSLLDRVFTLKRVSEMKPRIEEITHAVIDSWINDGECDFNSQFAAMVPGIFICEQLGLDGKDLPMFQKWVYAYLSLATRKCDEAQMREWADTELEMQHYLANVFEERRENPTDDLISAIVNAEGEDREPLTMHELQSVMAQLVAGGFETTQTAISHGMWRFLREPDLLEKVRADLSLMEPFCDETLRIESPTQHMVRLATRDVEVGGTVIPAGSVVLAGLGAANRDGDKFPCPHMFDLERANGRTHVAFGFGIHRCVGANLARQEIISALTAILERLDIIELACELPHPVHISALQFIPMKELPIRFTKR